MTDLTAPRTATLMVRWRPTAQVYEGRSRLLVALEKQGKLRAFKTEDDITRAIIQDEIEILLSPRHLAISDASGLEDPTSASFILESLSSVIDVRPNFFGSRFQHLIPLGDESAYDEARKSFCLAVFGDLADRFGISDTSTLIDGSTDSGRNIFQAEFGIVNRDEAAERLALEVGRLRTVEEPDFSHIDWGERGLPGVALYVSSNWHRHGERPDSIDAASLVEAAQQYREEAGNFARALFDKTRVEVEQ
ncbi:hypothetical protein ACWCYY_13310 [Kitasatospora sp. NPDC001664]